MIQIKGNFDAIKKWLGKETEKYEPAKAVVYLHPPFENRKGVWQHYGTKRGIPPRPWFGVRKDFEPTLEKIKHHWLSSDQTVKELIQDIANSLIANIKEGVNKQTDIWGKPFIPLKPSTVKRKKSSKALIDKGHMINSVVWKWL